MTRVKVKKAGRPKKNTAFDLTKFDFVIDKSRVSHSDYDVRLITYRKEKSDKKFPQYHYQIAFGKFYRDGDLNYTKVSIGVNGAGDKSQIVMVFDNTHFNGDNLDIKDINNSPRISSPSAAIRKILSSLGISQKQQEKGVEILWDVELVDAKQKVYILKQTSLRFLEGILNTNTAS